MAKDLNLANIENRAHLPVAEGYAVWAPTYDSDHNPLQAVDTIMLRTLIPEFLNLIVTSMSVERRQVPLQLVDLGCGTGRNTARLVSSLLAGQGTGEATSSINGASILGMELTPAMLEIAESKCNRVLQTADEQMGANLNVHFRQFDMLTERPTDDQSAEASAIPWGMADGVLSSLVIEHVPAGVFFATCTALLKPGGYLLGTNMHPDMGNVTGSGFTDQRTGGKVRIEGYNHSVQEFADEARKAGFVLLSDGIQEMTPTEDMVRDEESLRARGSKWIGTKIWMGAIWRKA